MSLSRPSRIVIAKGPSFAAAAHTPCRRTRAFSVTAAPRSRRGRSRFKNITAEAMGLTGSPDKLRDAAQQRFPDYTAEDAVRLREHYSPQQIAAIEAAEASIDSRDMVIQGRLRDDPYRPGYMDDLATIRPVIDLKTELKATPDPVRWLSHDAWLQDYIDNMSKKVESKVERTLAGSMARALRKVKQTEGDSIDITEDELRHFEENPQEATQLLEQQLSMRKRVVQAHIQALKDNPQLQIMPAEDDGPDRAAAAIPAPAPAPDPAPALPTHTVDDGQAAAAAGPDELTADELKRLSKRIDEEFFDDLEQVFNREANPLLPTEIEMWKEVDESGDRRTSALAADIKRIPGLEDLYAQRADDDVSREDQPEFAERLTRVTGISLQDIRRLMIKPLHARFVSNQTRLGKIASMRVITIAGNGDGWLGVGIAKSVTAETAMMMSKLLAIRSMRPIRRYENRTIYGDVRAKISGTIVELSSRPPGFGLRVSHRIFEMCRAAGIHDLSGSIPRSRNPMNTIKAAFQALLNQPDPEEIARGRGMKLVDVRKVYWGGNVY